jgi:signal peptidase I
MKYLPAVCGAVFSLLCFLIKPETVFVINVSASVPRGIYLLLPSPPERGDVIAINSDNVAFNNAVRNTLFLKKIAYAGNEKIRSTDEYLIVDNTDRYRKFRDIGLILDTSLRDDECIILGTHERSFDSRYFGPVKLADCKRAVPLLVIDRI